MKLVIAEKPSVAQSIAVVLGAEERKDGYLEGGEYLVSWCFGHLLELAQPEAYGQQYARWNYRDLPILPETWKYEVPEDKKKQLFVLVKLMNDKRVERVVCATDAGREGELIFRLAYEYARCRKPVERLWISSMEDNAVREAFGHLRPGREYDRLYDAALCRAKADWMVGINATRLFSVLYGVTLNVGRVMSPTLALLVQREEEIGKFKSRPFYVPEIRCGEFTASGERIEEKETAEKIRKECNGQTATVLEIEKQIKTVQPPRLYDLTMLQRECNRIYGYTAQQTLDYLQALYEKKLATYPRTDSQYLTEDMKDTAAVLVAWMREHFSFGKACRGEADIERVTDGTKVTDHHAVIPTLEITKKDLSELPKGERDVLMLIAGRLLCATAQIHRCEEVRAEISCGGYPFTAKGKSVLREGWKGVEQSFRNEMLRNEKKETDGCTLPELLKGQQFGNVAASIREGKTSPPKHYTEDSLLAAMETAGSGDMPEDAERKGLGTPATRAAILEKLVKTGLAERKKKQLVPTEKGITLITVLPEEIKSPMLTAEWETKLKEVERGELDAESFIEKIADMSCHLVKSHPAPEEQFAELFPDAKGKHREAVGTCPRCGAPVLEGKKVFSATMRTVVLHFGKRTGSFRERKNLLQEEWRQLC